MEFCPISFIDVDHTLTRHSTGFHFALEAGHRGVFKTWHLATIPLNFLIYRFGYVGFESLPKNFPALRGLSRSLLDEISVSAFEKKTRFDIYPEARDLVLSLKASGSRVVLATAGLDFIVQPLASYLGISDVISSSLEFVDGSSTGRFEGNPIFGNGKKEEAEKNAALWGQPLSSCSFYSDSFHDMPLLMNVGMPVAVNPDRRLYRAALAKSWKILKFL
jgi:HAD superfamily hydrolase (TIGR01490 family)